MTVWKIAEPADGVNIYAEQHSLRLSNVSSLSLSTKFTPKTRLGKFLPVLVPQLLEMGLATLSGDDLVIAYDDFVSFEEQDFNAFDELAPWSPFLVDVRSAGIPGRSNFSYEIRYFWGDQQVFLARLGCFVKRNEQICRLDKRVYALAEEIDKFNRLPGNEKENSDSFIHFAAIKKISQELGVTLDSFMQKFRVIVPPDIGLDFITEADDRISFVPKLDIEGVPAESLHKVFLESEDPTDLSIQTPDGEYVKIVFNDNQKEALRRMQRVRKVGGKERTEALRNPQEVMEGVSGAVEIDAAVFGKRVKGIGDFPFVSQMIVQSSKTGIFDDFEVDGEDSKEQSKVNIGIKVAYADGTQDEFYFKTRKDLLDFNNKVKSAVSKGEDIVDLDGKSIVLDKEFTNGLDLIIERITKQPAKSETDEKKRSYLLIYENEEEREYIEDRKLQAISSSDFSLPKSLIKKSILKKHQENGVKWLQQNYLLSRGGCLLADDMGLGKTLQVLTFLAWLIERGDISPDKQKADAMPWNPVLIVAPVMLLESETWINDMKDYFKDEGAIFSPCITLHGDKLKKFRKPEGVGSETIIGQSVLDLEKLRGYRVIITNYETIVNYQFSFAMMKNAWSVIVTDEAQEYKTPKTKISHALKSLSPSFRIACTGTPVETKLSDLWNIFDFLQPGNLLGSAKEFNDEFVRPYENQNETSKEVLDRLRKKLYYGTNKAYVLRRDKENELEGLPQKDVQRIVCNLSDKQRNMHIDIIKRAKTGGEDNHPFSLIQLLMKLYQHPALIPRYEPYGREQVNDAIAQCSKLQKLIDILKDIRLKGEKVLIFTRSTDMQQILATIINTTFGLNVDILNGASPRKGSTLSGITTRKEIIKRFKDHHGFNVIILSPDVAGVGLTLVEANHVIHYGRWWNPAKEAQATDRAYRIGQTKKVIIYYLIAKDPQNKFKTFDEKLDDLIERRRKMATDFLAPLPAEQQNEAELYDAVFSEGIGTEAVKGITTDDVRKLPWERFEALVALLEEKQGRKSILTPRSGDFGIDVISIEGQTLRLIQCKHTLWDTSLNVDVISETVKGLENYRGRILRNIAPKFIMKPVLLTNGKCGKSIERTASENDVEVIGVREIEKALKMHSCTFAEIEQKEMCRCVSPHDIQKILLKLIHV